MKRKLSWKRCYLLVFCSLALFRVLPAYGGANVIAWECGNAFGQGQYGETNVPPDLTNAVAIAAGGFHNLALRSDGTVVAWGRNLEGQTSVPPGLSNVIAVAAGYYHSIALEADGTVVVWGANNFGQTNVPAGLFNVVAIAGSYYDTFVLKADGTVLAWGDDSINETNIPVGLSNVVAISSGFYNNMALLRDGTVASWGGGIPTSITNVPSDLTNAVAITCSMSISVEHCLALRSDGAVTSWGYAQDSVPLGLSNVCAIAAGGAAYASPPTSRDLALKTDGSLVGWGSTTNLPVNQSNIVAIASGEAHQIALLGNGLPVQSVKITSPFLSGTNFCVQVPAQSGRVYSLEYKNSLNDADWIPLPLVAGVAGVPLILTDPSGISNQRFYRVRRW